MKSLNQRGVGLHGLLLVIIAVLMFAIVSIFAYQRIQTQKSFQQNNMANQQISTFGECVAAGNSVMESYPERCVANNQTFINEDKSLDEYGYSEPIVSGHGTFEVSLPNTWGVVVNASDEDRLQVVGQNQPEGRLMVQGATGLGGGGSNVFSVLVHDNFADPQGKAHEYTLVNGKEYPITGQKFVYVYEKDTVTGIGVDRFKNDRDYTYVFPIDNGKELRVYYSIYGRDPRNNINTVEAIIDSIRLR